MNTWIFLGYRHMTITLILKFPSTSTSIELVSRSLVIATLGIIWYTPFNNIKRHHHCSHIKMHSSTYSLPLSLNQVGDWFPIFSFSYPIFIVYQLCLGLELNIISFSCIGLNVFVSYVEASLLLLMCISNSYHVVFFKFVYICLYPITCKTNHMIHDKKHIIHWPNIHLAKNITGNPEKIYDHIGNPIISAIKIFTHLKPIQKPFSKPKPVLLFNVINWDAWLES